MKRIALFFLIACLCCSFVACDMGNGLVAELLGGIRNDYGYGYVEPPIDIYESEYVAIDPIEPWGTVEIQTTPPYEIETEYVTVDEYWSEDVIIDPAPRTQVAYSAVDYINAEYILGCEVVTELLYTNDQPWVDPTRVTVEQGCDWLYVGGVLGLTDANYAIFGYSINGQGPYYAKDYQKDPDPELKEVVSKMGADFISEYQVTIPLESLPAGNYEIMIWYANYNNEAELSTNVEDALCVFNVEIAELIMD